MINSIISSSHHYYLAFFESTQLKSINKIVDLFPVNPKSISLNPGSEGFSHLQEEIGSLYGSEILLAKNKGRDRKGIPHYWYDFYYGFVDQERKIYFICYPYSKLSRFLERGFDEKALKPNFFKANVEKVLEHMRNRGKKTISRIERQGFEIDITKYTAEVKEEANANKVSLVGANPLNSRIFDVLNDDKSITIEATALKIKCRKDKIGEIELAFDRLGNFRFWLKKNSQEVTLPMIKFVFQFFSEISSLDKTQFLSRHTFLEDE